MAYFQMSKSGQGAAAGLQKARQYPALGAGASWAHDLQYVTGSSERGTGFDGICEKTAWWSDRDFVIEFISDASLIMMHLSASSKRSFGIHEFGAYRNGWCLQYGSSIMPQKKKSRCGRTDPRQNRKGARKPDSNTNYHEGLPWPITRTCRKTNRLYLTCGNDPRLSGDLCEMLKTASFNKKNMKKGNKRRIWTPPM